MTHTVSNALNGALSAAFDSRSSVGTRMRRAAEQAFRRNSIDLGVMATPPTIAVSSTNPDATLTNAYRTSTGQTGSFRFTGGTSTQGPGAYTAYRIAPVVTMPGGTGGNTPGSGGVSNMYQWAAEFHTDAPKVLLRLLTTPSIQVEVDDQPISSAVTVVGGGGGTMYALLDFTAAGGSANRKIRVEMATSSGFDGVYVGPTYSVWAPASDTNLRVCVVGDSIETGTGAALPNGAANKVLGKLLGWTDVRQVAFGGTGFINIGASLNTLGAAQRVADAVATSPDLLLIVTSQNDDASSAASITAAALAAYQAYRAALPGVTIVAAGAHAGSSGPSANHLRNETAAKAAFDQWADGNSFWIPISTDATGSWESGTGRTSATTGTGNRDRFGFDVAHPNDLGHAYLGRRLAAAFRALVLPNLR